MGERCRIKKKCNTECEARKRERFFEEIREELRHWPYTIHQIDDTLDISLIEGRAKQILFQALNGRNLTAFVGSGVASGYGRLSWSEWQRTQVDVVKGAAESFVALCEIAGKRMNSLEKIVDPAGSFLAFQDALPSSPNMPPPLDQADLRNIWRWLRHEQQQAILYAKREVAKLHSTFDLATSADGEFPGGESLPIKFEIAKKLHDLLLQYSSLFLPQKGVIADDETRRQLGKEAWCGCRAELNKEAPADALNRLYKCLKYYVKIYPSNLKIRYLKYEKPKKFNYISSEIYKVKSKIDYFFTKQQKKDYTESVEFEKHFIAYCLKAGSREALLQFDQLVKVLVADECAHAEQLLLSGLDYSAECGRTGRPDQNWIDGFRNALNVITEDNLKRGIDGIRQRPGRYKVLSAFKHETVKALIEHV